MNFEREPDPVDAAIPDPSCGGVRFPCGPRLVCRTQPMGGGKFHPGIPCRFGQGAVASHGARSLAADFRPGATGPISLSGHLPRGYQDDLRARLVHKRQEPARTQVVMSRRLGEFG